MYTVSILIGSAVVLNRIAEWMADRETIEPLPLGEPRPTSTPPPWDVGA